MKLMITGALIASALAFAAPVSAQDQGRPDGGMQQDRGPGDQMRHDDGPGGQGYGQDPGRRDGERGYSDHGSGDHGSGDHGSGDYGSGDHGYRGDHGAQNAYAGHSHGHHRVCSWRHHHRACSWR